MADSIVKTVRNATSNSLVFSMLGRNELASWVGQII